MGILGGVYIMDDISRLVWPGGEFKVYNLSKRQIIYSNYVVSMMKTSVFKLTIGFDRNKNSLKRREDLITYYSGQKDADC